MKLSYYLWIIVAFTTNNVLPMEHTPDLILELVWLFGALDCNSAYALALVRKEIFNQVAKNVKEKEKLLENNYNSLLEKKEYNHGALVTLSRDRNTYGFIGVKILSEESCAHDEHCELSLVIAKVLPVAMRDSYAITETYGDPDLKDGNYPWIKNFNNLSLSVPSLKYCCHRTASMFSTVIIEKPAFKDDSRLITIVDFHRKTYGNPEIGNEKFEFEIDASQNKISPIHSIKKAI